MARSGHTRHFSQLRMRALSRPGGVPQTACQRYSAAHAAICQGVGCLATNCSWQSHAGHGVVPTESDGDQQASAVHADVVWQCYLHNLIAWLLPDTEPILGVAHAGRLHMGISG